MSHVSAASFLVVYFLMGYFAIMIDSLILHSKFTPAANFVVLILSLRWTIFKSWNSTGAKTKHAVFWSVFSAFVTVMYLHVLHYVSEYLLRIKFDQMSWGWSISVFCFNFFLSFVSLKIFHHMDRENKDPVSS